MEERFKQRKKQKLDSGISSNQEFKISKLGAKSKQQQQLLTTENFELKSESNTEFNKKLEFKDADMAREFEIKSSSDHLKIGFQQVQGTNSGFFFAITYPENNLSAVLEDEADPTFKQQTFNGQGKIRTHIVPTGKIGDVAKFSVTDTNTGDVASAQAVTIPLGAQTIWSIFKNIFK